MTLLEHLEELRGRLLKSLYGLALGFAVAFYYSDQILDFFLSPLKRVMPEGAFVQYTNLPEPLIVEIKLSLIGGFFLASPWVFLQLWRFIAPGLYPGERRMVIPFVFFSTLFFSCGAVFCFHYVFPPAFEYFVKTFTNPSLRAIPSLEQYYRLASKMLLSFGIVFELPVACYFLGRLGILTARGMLATWRFVVVGIFVVAAFLTPGPDVLSQLLLAAPLLVLYALSILVVWMTGRQREEVVGEG